MTGSYEIVPFRLGVGQLNMSWDDKVQNKKKDFPHQTFSMHTGRDEFDVDSLLLETQSI